MQVRGREIDDYLAPRNPVSERLKGGDRPEKTLLDGGIGQSDEVDPYAEDHVHFDGDGYCIDPDALGSCDIYKHGGTIVFR